MNGKSIWAVVAGLLVIIGVTTLVDIVLHAAGVFPPVGQAIKTDRGSYAASYGRMRAITRYPSGMPASPEARMKLKTSTLLLGLLLHLPSAVSASSIIPQPWQPIVNNADMVGIIECVTAGEIVARYAHSATLERT